MRGEVIKSLCNSRITKRGVSLFCSHCHGFDSRSGPAFIIPLSSSWSLNNLSPGRRYSGSFRSHRLGVCNGLSSIIGDAYPWVHLFHALIDKIIIIYNVIHFIKILNLGANDFYLFEFGMRQSIDYGIPHAWSLGEKNGKFGHDRVDERRIAPGTSIGDDYERGPRHNPESDVDNGHFSSAIFGRKLLLIGIGSQGSDVHFLGLFTKRFLVIEDGSDDENVAANNDENVDGDGNGHWQDEALVVHILAKIVVRAPWHQRNVKF